jgi:glycosyltransferase involved in cell wall biosynthesis
MRVLLVSHNFLPAHGAGTEIYTAQLGLQLARRGHDVRVFTADKDIARANWSVVERDYRGLGVTEVVNNLFYGEFRETWDCPEVARIFGELLDRTRPDVVHFQHLLYLSVGCVEEAARRMVPVVFTLHDYWLQCARFGQRVHADTSICDRIDFTRCGECLTSFKFRQSKLERTTGKVIARVRGSTGIDLSNAARRAARMLERDTGQSADLPPIDRERARELAGEVERRERAMRERVVPHVFRFLSPSRFLRERFVEWGIAPQQIQFLRTGIDLEHFAGAARTTPAGAHAAPLRVAFIGTLVRHKGPHVLLDAWSRLSDAQRARGRLDIFGPGQHQPEYQAELAARAAAVGAKLRGALTREQVALELARTDLLVVPSVWYENSPLVIIEAIALRTPILVSAIGGMAELVVAGESGEHFQVGDAAHLAQKLGALLDDPARLARFYAHDQPIKNVAQDAQQIEEIYFEALDDARARMQRAEAEGDAR